MSPVLLPLLLLLLLAARGAVAQTCHHEDSSSPEQIDSTALPSPIDDDTDHFFFEDGNCSVPAGQNLCHVVIRTFSEPILSISVSTVGNGGLTDDGGYVGTQCVTTNCTSPGFGVIQSMDVTPHVVVSGPTAIVVLSARNEACCGCGWGPGFNLGRLHWHVELGCPVPQDETTGFSGWSPSEPTKGWWKQLLSPANFAGKTVMELDPGGGGPDTCWFPGSMIAPATQITGGSWLVQTANTWGPDSVGWKPNAVTYYRGRGRAPCGTQFPQQMAIECRPGFFQNYCGINLLQMSMTSTTVTSSRAGHTRTRVWP